MRSKPRLSRGLFALGSLIFAAGLLSVCAQSTGFQKEDPTLKCLSDSLVGHTFTLTRQPNHSGTLYLHLGTNDYVCRIEPGALFPLPEDLPGVKITGVKKASESEILLRASAGSTKGANRLGANPDDVVLESTLYKVSLRHPTLGRGNILITTATGELPRDTNHIISALAFLLSGESLPAPKQYVVNGTSKVAHYVPSGHASVENDSRLFSSREEVKSGGCEVCPLCFNRLVRLPMLRTEIAMGKEVEAAVRHNERFCDSPEMQARLTRVGRDVVSHWPSKLKGYDYRFSVMDEGRVNASACPGGYIFVNRGLMEVLEDDTELEAVLAHEIAHVEQRHGLMEYVKAQRDNRNAIIFASLVTVGIAAGSAASGNQDAIQIASAGGGVSLLLASLAAKVASVGYSKQHEQEADIYALIYMQSRGKPKSSLLSVLKKLRTNNEIEYSMSGEKQLNTTHPEIKDRLYAAETLEVQPFGEGESYDAFDKTGERLYTLTLHAQARYQKRDGRQSVLMLGEVSTTAAIGESEEFSQLQLAQGKTTSALNTDGDVKIGALETLAVSFSRTAPTLDFAKGEFVPSLNGISASRVIKK